MPVAAAGTEAHRGIINLGDWTDCFTSPQSVSRRRDRRLSATATLRGERSASLTSSVTNGAGGSGAGGSGAGVRGRSQSAARCSSQLNRRQQRPRLVIPLQTTGLPLQSTGLPLQLQTTGLPVQSTGLPLQLQTTGLPVQSTGLPLQTTGLPPQPPNTVCVIIDAILYSLSSLCNTDILWV